MRIIMGISIKILKKNYVSKVYKYIIIIYVKKRIHNQFKYFDNSFSYLYT